MNYNTDCYNNKQVHFNNDTTVTMQKHTIVTYTQSTNGFALCHDCIYCTKHGELYSCIYNKIKTALLFRCEKYECDGVSKTGC